MSESTTAVAAETPATPAPIGSLENLTDYRARRSEVEALVDGDAPAANAPAAEPAAPAAAPEPAAEPDPSSEAGRELAKKRGSLQARIDEVTREKHEAVAAERRRIAELEAQIAALKPAVPATPAEPVVDPADPEPQVDQFDTYEKYVKATSRWEARQEAKAIRQQIEGERFGAAVQQAQQRVEAAAKAEYPDFETVMHGFAEAGGKYAPHVADTILNHPDGHKLAYVLAKDPALNTRLAAIGHPIVYGIELGKVLAGLPAKAAAVVVEEKPAAPVSKAPAPVKPIVGEAPATGADPAKMSSVRAWEQERKKYL
jgi:hypothetical protein